jgi:peptidoglycan hydrolase-like protein with peptidoglycan-binding domain
MIICCCILAGCSVVSDVMGNGESNALQKWNELVIAENAYSYSELSILPEGTFAVMAAPKLRLFKFDNGWTEVSAGQFQVPDSYPEYSDLDWNITIQSALITDDSALDFVVRYDPAPWDVLDVPNQGRSWGTVISGQGGQWRSVDFTDPYADGAPYNSIEYIEYVNGALIGQWFGSCGRPCGLLVYTWVGGSQQLSGTEATKSQENQLTGRNCADFSYAGVLPIRKCSEGLAVEYIQRFLNELGFELELDGYFGSGTEFAVKYFQRENSIRATGLVDLDTWKALLGGTVLPGNDLDGNGVITPEEFPGM